jgi:hypothetical protein
MTGSWSDEPRAGFDLRIVAEQSPFGVSLTAGGKPDGLAGLELAQPFHADFVRLTTEHPPVNIPKPGAINGAPPVFMDGNKVSPFKRHDQLAGLPPVAVLFGGDAL